MEPSEHRTINNADKSSATALKLKEIYLARLDTLRRQNDNDMDEKNTARLRGRIAEVKMNLLALGHSFPKAPKVVSDD